MQNAVSSESSANNKLRPQKQSPESKNASRGAGATRVESDCYLRIMVPRPVIFVKEGKEQEKGQAVRLL